MQQRTTTIILSVIVFSLAVYIFPLLLFAQQEERPCFSPCTESPAEISITYGDRSCDLTPNECQINETNDLDIFNFVGADGDKVRFMVKNISNGEYLQIQVYDPDGDMIVGTQVNNAYIDRDLSKSGEYTIVISDHLQDDSGYSYILHVEKIPPDYYHPCLEYDSTECDRIDYPMDMDFFYFHGAESTRVRFQLTNQSNGEYLQIQVYDPDGDMIVGTQVNNAYIDRDLSKSGEYTIVISDHLRDTTVLSDYCLQIQCLLGDCPFLCPIPDCDEDGVFDDGDESGIAGDNPCPDGVIENCDDNCTCIPNGPLRGTCVHTSSGLVGESCISNAECSENWFCSINQEDSDDNGLGDVCESVFCKGNFDFDLDVDGGDAFVFKTHFGRSTFKNPCPPDGPAPVEKTHQTTPYATGDDGEHQSGVPFPEPRFVDNEDGTVRDNLTGLTWVKNANCFGQKTWSEALSDCIGLADGQCELTDDSQVGAWRLPSVKELQSLVDYGHNDPALPAGHFFTNIDSLNLYWSSTSLNGSAGHAWCVGMISGNVFSVGKGEQGYLWPVRGGH